jgi:hypothetical protein
LRRRDGCETPERFYAEKTSYIRHTIVSFAFVLRREWGQQLPPPVAPLPPHDVRSGGGQGDFSVKGDGYEILHISGFNMREFLELQGTLKFV